LPRWNPVKWYARSFSIGFVPVLTKLIGNKKQSQLFRLHSTSLNSMEMRRPFSHISGYQYPYPPSNVYSYIPYVAHPAVADPNAAHYYYYNYGVDPSQYNHKRQRRQAAAVVVESLWNNKTMGRKSTAQPRPQITVPPRGIGPIVDPNENDVLCGRGGRINSHTGNIKFRDTITEKKKEYLAPATKKLEKAHIAASIVYDIRALDPPGRFLKEDRDTGLWFDIGDAKAIKKTGQALREDAPEIRPELEGDSSGDDKAETKEETKEEKKAEKPKASPKPKAATTPKSPPQEKTTAGGNIPQLPPGNWQQANRVAGMMSPHDYQAQIAMPPPFPFQANPYMQQQQQQQQQLQFQQQQTQQQGFEGRTIPIQSPMPQAIYQIPNRLVTGATNAGRRVANASRHAMDALSYQGGQVNQQGQIEVPPDNVAFGRQFYEPADTVLSSGNTMSTLSGISDPISSTLGGSASDFGRGSALSGMSGLSGLSGLESRNSLRGSARGLGSSGMGRSSRRHFLEAMKGENRMSDMTVSGRSLGSIGRSLSFDDMNGVNDEIWQAIMEDEEMLHHPETSLLSGEAPSGRFSIASGRMPHRDSSAMSIASMSTASSNRWLAGMRDSTVTTGDDGRSVHSEMSTEMHALDLAHPH
jgi:hypothetical protein